MFDWSEFPELVVQAGLIVVAVGVGVAAALQIIKEVVGFWTDIPAEVMSMAAAILSCSATAWILIQSGTPWLVALLAAFAAVYVPKAAHDVMSKLKPAKKLRKGKPA